MASRHSGWATLTGHVEYIFGLTCFLSGDLADTFNAAYAAKRLVIDDCVDGSLDLSSLEMSLLADLIEHEHFLFLFLFLAGSASNGLQSILSRWRRYPQPGAAQARSARLRSLEQSRRLLPRFQRSGSPPLGSHESIRNREPQGKQTWHLQGFVSFFFRNRNVI